MCFTGLQLQAQIDQHQSDIDILSDTVSESSVDIDAPPSSSVENSYTHSSGSRTTDPVNSSDSSSSQSSPPPSVDFQLPKLVRQRRVYFDVQSLLQERARGQAVIRNVQKDRLLTPSDRRILVSVCVADLILKHGEKPSSFHKEALAQAITEAFPCLKDSRGRGHEAFYMKGSTGRPASGWLEEHLKYTRKRLKRSETPAVDPKVEEEETCDVDKYDDMTEEEITMMKTWMQHNDKPRATLEEYMQKTVKKRTRLIQTSGFEEAIRQYPKLLCPGMIEQDFQLRFPKAADKLYQKWPTLHQTVTVFAEKNFPGWKQQLPWDCSFLDDEEIAFLALPLVFQSRHKTKKGKGSSSVTSCVKSFIDIQPNLTSIGLYCEEIDAKARPQPFIVILWDLLQRTRQFFVLFERKPLPSPSLLKAIDTCFKLHYVFDLNYQADCVASWQFLQNIIFEMNSTASTEISTVKAFRAYYNSL